jgi:predicted RNA binding protein YcfA (HicA-like mRNA interferase family)
MGKLSSISTKEAIHAFERAGFAQISQVGSHLKMRRLLQNGQFQTIIIPNHRLLKEGTLRNGILKPIGMTSREFVNLLKK